MKVNGFNVPYPKDRLSQLEEYKEKMMEHEDSSEHGSPEVYESKILQNNIVEVKRREAMSPILKRLIVSEQSDNIRPLKTIGSEVVGGLFDRVKFLKERIKETEATAVDRKSMNDKFNEEIDVDIAEMQKIIPTISDIEQAREFKINLNLLKMEKRRENNLFWKDMVTLKAQLRELNEKLEVESKIASLFSGL